MERALPRTRQVWSGEPNATLVAELEGLASGRALDRLFQQALGQAPMKYLVDWRMTLARDLLLTQNLVPAENLIRAAHAACWYS
jgi:AraC-like DNA-binding protein